MQMHVVLYKTYPANPKAAAMIVDKACELLTHPVLPKLHHFFAGEVIDSSRAVGDNNYNVMLAMGFQFSWDYLHYMEHDQHKKFVRFVLRGWMLEGSQAADPEEEFISHILTGQTVQKWQRNSAIPDEEVVWGGEVVFDALS